MDEGMARYAARWKRRLARPLALVIAVAVPHGPASGDVGSKAAGLGAPAKIEVPAGVRSTALPFVVGLSLVGLVPSLADHMSGEPHPEADAVVPFGRYRVPREILATVLEAAVSTGVDPAYLCALAEKESTWSADARARTSSALGLYQFIESTWLRMVKSHGTAVGLRDEAALIEMRASGPHVADARARSRILELREDVRISSVLAAEMFKRDRAAIAGRLGREINATEAYLAHFLGPAAAVRVLAAVEGAPRRSAAAMVPASARANRTLFYERRGRRLKPLGLAEFVARLERMIVPRLERYAQVAAVAR